MATSTPTQSVTPAVTVTPAKRKFYEVPTVTLFVGKSKKPFYVHFDPLCDASPFFRAAFAGNFKESSEKTMLLPEDDESTFELFVDWLYYQRYEMLPEVECDEDEDNERFLQAFRLFVFADKYEAFKLKSLVIETLFVDAGGAASGIDLAAIAYVYKHTTQDSGLRKLLADWHAWKGGLGSLGWFECPSVQAFLRQQPDFATDISISFAKHLPTAQTYRPFTGDMPEEYKDNISGQKK